MRRSILSEFLLLGDKRKGEGLSPLPLIVSQEDLVVCVLPALRRSFEVEVSKFQFLVEFHEALDFPSVHFFSVHVFQQFV